MEFRQARQDRRCARKRFGARFWLAAFIVQVWVLSAQAPLWAQDSPGPPVQEGPLREELNDYWTVDRDLPVVQNRLYSLEGRFSAGLYVGLMSSEPFYTYYPAGLRLGYHFTETLALEVSGQYMDGGILRQESDLTTFLLGRCPADERDEGCTAFDPELDTEDIFQWRAHAALTWHPLYGKWALLQRKLSHFDLSVTAGLGAVSLIRPNLARSEVDTVITPEVVLGVGAHFFLSESVVLRLDGRGYGYLAGETASRSGAWERLSFPVEFQLGASYFF